LRLDSLQSERGDGGEHRAEAPGKSLKRGRASVTRR
jgi:hypothetical protein